MNTHNFSEAFCPNCEEVRLLPLMQTNGRCSLCGDYARDCTCSEYCSVCDYELEITK